jgi:hypothetical protein
LIVRLQLHTTGSFNLAVVIEVWSHPPHFQQQFFSLLQLKNAPQAAQQQLEAMHVCLAI